MHARPRRGTTAALWAALLVLAGPRAWSAPAKPPIEVENLRIGFSNNTENNLFKVGAWVPVWVQLRAGDRRFSGAMELTVPDDDGTPTVVHQPIDVAPGESQRVTTYARPGTNDPEFEIRLIDPGRKIRTPRISAASLGNFTPRALRPDDVLLLTLGKPQGVELIPGLPGFGGDQNAGGQIAVARVDAAGGLIPGRWQGYDAARAIVLDTNDREVMATLDPLRGRALVEWVRRGGHLVLGLGGNWQQVRDSAIGPLLPAVPVGQERINDLGALETFAAGSTKPITPPGSAPVMITKLDSAERRGGKVLSTALGLPLIVRGSHGFGRVTVIALDVDQRPFATWEDRGLFWVRALDLRRTGGEATPAAVGMPRGFYQSGVNDLSSQLRRALEQFQGVRLISFGWVAFFIFLYILLIGPGDYLFLKKVLKRMELTWITFPLIVVTVSLLAYYAAYLVKGNDLRVNKVDVVDVLQPPGPEDAVPPSGLVRGWTTFDIFSPQNRDYDVTIAPLPLDREAPPAQDEASPMRPPAGTEVMLSWFGVPEPGFGGMGNSGRMSFSGGGYAYLPPGSSETLAGVRVPIWSTKCLTARWFGPGPAGPLLDADLRPAGPDRLEGTVTNLAGTPLLDAVLAFNRQVYLLGTIAPGATVRVELMRDRQLSGHLQGKTSSYLANANGVEAARLSRPDLLLGMMFHDSVANATAEAPVASNVLHGLDLTGLLALDRPMLVARVDRPASRLVIENAPSPPKVDQTTLLRVILPLKTAQQEPDDGAASTPNPKAAP